ncbi:NAD(P)/FAD-dependent oxidoreductase [Halorientalis marina]|uniref:NAD(P)/FAD-dependent oxidoreductase n=1 Tax=Halorientalis marina TaxID=2931976 RepID=UPI001FF6F5FA|nr:FAD-dependent oxidoreductase [Halorientalis marina]
MTATVGIVGGGIAGTAAAYGLRDAPVDVTLFEAVDDVGGRMVTRQRGGCTYDYGANFLKGADERFRTVLGEAVGGDLQTVDGDVWVFDADGTIESGRDDQAPKYTTPDGVRGIATAFARESGAELLTGTRVGHLDRTGDGWRLSTTGDREERINGLVLALPAGETASLLADADWGGEYCSDLMTAAGRVPYRPVDSVVCHYPFRLDRPYYALVSRDDDHEIGWCSREECKPGHVPDGESLLVVQLNPRWTESRPEADDREIERVACTAAADLLDDDRLREPDWVDQERWTAAVPDHGINPALIERAPRYDLAIAGDWVAGTGRTYAALQTGLDAADRIRERII